jgi:Protein of unknown function (DUF3999)
MRQAVLLLLAFLFVGADAHGPAITYFAMVRDVHITQPDRQNFFVVDLGQWNHSRSDLGDLRLYDSGAPVQYTIVQQSAAVSSEEVNAKVLNLGRVAGHTEFDLDVNGIAEYDRIRLRIDAKDFVATAFVFGESEPGQPSIALEHSTLFDFSGEHLGSSTLLKLPSSSSRYLHVRLSPGIRPQQVKGAAISNLREQQASWVRAGFCGTPRQQPPVTVIACAVPSNVPVQRLRFEVDPVQVNFYRSVTVEDSKAAQLAGGNISRVRVSRGGTLLPSEELSLDRVTSSGKLVVRIENGDNPPLAIVSVQPEALERRVYFNPQGKTSLKLYYGDQKLSAPVYDYARFFQKDAAAAEAELGAEAVNSEYTGRPDERPWSERHKAVLWAAMLLAVLALGTLAIRGLRTASAA